MLSPPKGFTRLRVWARGATLDEATVAAWQGLGTALGANAGDKLSDAWRLCSITVEVHTGGPKKVKGRFDFEEVLPF